jgi:hypothetical protein
MSMKAVVVLVGVGVLGCSGTSTGVPNIDAAPEVDSPPGTPDARPTPDAAPGTPDAHPTPDARPVTPDAAPVLATRFDTTAEDWPVPMSGLIDGFFDDQDFASFRYWTLIDIDGDHRLDIVQTGDTSMTQGVWDATGSPYWKVFSGGASGWTTAATQFAVPANTQAGGFFTTDVTNGGYEWVTIDMDGDGRPDLVHTVDPSTGRVWDATGSPHWKVYPNQGGSFGAAIIWPVPDSGTTAGFYKTHSPDAGARWALVDIDGDHRPDLVQTSDPSTGTVWDPTGAPHWKVFFNNGSGFSAVATIWAVPDGGATGFYDVDGIGTPRYWTTVDLNGDGVLDLVQTSDPATGYVWDSAGAPYWKVFVGGAAGFAAAPIQWRVPPSGLVDGFYSDAVGSSARWWGLLDIDGDGLLDLVQTGDTAQSARVWDATGDPYWKVYYNQRNSFSTTLYRWPVPTAGTLTGGFYAFTGDVAPGFWFVADVNSDGLPDLVHAADPATSRIWDAAGAPYWKVYLGKP